MGVLNDTMMMGASAAGGYEIEQSLRFNDDDTAYLSRTPSVAGNRKTWTWSGWVKRGNLGTYQRLLTVFNSSTSQFTIGYTSADKLELFQYTGSYQINLTSTSLYRDASAWYHLTLEIDTTLAASADRVKIYINSEQVTAFDTAVYPTQNTDLLVNDATPLYIGKKDAGDYLDGYLAEVNFIDGLALTPDSFGETGDYGEWKPLKYTGAYGTNGFYLDFKSSGSLGNDAAGSNNWTPTNLAATDQMLDSPTNNFATLNPLSVTDATSPVFSEGNLKTVVSIDGSKWGGSSTFGRSSGKSYFEVICTEVSNVYIGILDETAAMESARIDDHSVTVGNAIYYRSTDGGKRVITNGTTVTSAYASTYTTTDIIGVAFDADNSQITFYKNNTSLGALTIPTTSEDLFIGVSGGTGNAQNTFYLNTGQDSSFAGNKTAQGNSDSNGIGDFYYAPPAGFLALCTQNLPDATVIPSEHFNTVLYAGNDSTQSITGVGFQPDFTWIKNRTSARDNNVFDSVRGATYKLETNTTAVSFASAASLTSFDSDGFSLGSYYEVNENATINYAAWNWKANGTGVSNTDGTITSTVSANVEAGFSIISYTGTNTDGVTVGHGLSRYPEIVIFKNREATSNWLTMTSMLSNVGYLSSTTAFTVGRSFFSQSENSTWTSSIGLDAHVACNSADDFIAYAFHSVDGYSKVGSYTGNGSTDGTFVHCGFRPAYVMVKYSSGVQGWYVFDDKRNTYNVGDKYLRADSSAGEGTFVTHDLTSTGFKLRTADSGFNASGGSYIFLAFAESPFKYSNAR